MTAPYRNSDGKVVLTDAEYHDLTESLKDAQRNLRTAHRIGLVAALLLTVAVDASAMWFGRSTAHWEPDAVASGLSRLPPSPSPVLEPGWEANSNVLLLGGLDNTTPNRVARVLHVDALGRVQCEPQP